MTHIFNVGDLATQNWYTDRHADRIIEVRRNGKEVVFQEDTVTEDSSYKPEMVPGGFFGHVVNQSSQRWVTTPNPNGRTSIHTLRKWGDGQVWTVKGDKPTGRSSLSEGSHHYYDYNF